MTGDESDGTRPELSDLLEDREDGGELRRIWRLLSRAEESREYDVDREWAELERELDAGTGELRLHRSEEESAARPEGGSPRRLPFSRPVAAAAVLALALLGAATWWVTTPASATAPPGRQATVTLPDGSTARLNADSRIRWDRGFSALPGLGSPAREVRLRGEAHFTVREGDRSFRVRTRNASVEVLGTEFTVRARRTGDGGGPTVTEVVLASGRLAVTGRDAAGGAPDTVRLTRPGERSRVVDGRRPSAPTTVDLERATAWIDGGFSMTDAPVAEVVRELERRFDAEIRLRARGVAREVVTLHYGSSVAAEEVLSDLAVLVGLNYRRTAAGYELFRE